MYFKEFCLVRFVDVHPDLTHSEGKLPSKTDPWEWLARLKSDRAKNGGIEATVVAYIRSIPVRDDPSL
jgi:hypothetical protein